MQDETTTPVAPTPEETTEPTPSVEPAPSAEPTPEAPVETPPAAE